MPGPPVTTEDIVYSDSSRKLLTVPADYEIAAEHRAHLFADGDLNSVTSTQVHERSLNLLGCSDLVGLNALPSGQEQAYYIAQLPLLIVPLFSGRLDLCLPSSFDEPSLYRQH